MDNNLNTSQAGPEVLSAKPEGEFVASNQSLPINDTPPPVTIAPAREVVAPPEPVATFGTVPAAPSVNVSGNVAYASLTSRSLAGFIDGLIVGAVSMVFNSPSIYSQIVSISSSSYSSISNSGAAQITTSSNPLFSFLSILGTIFGIVYPIYFIGKTGATPGKKIMKIKVIDKESGQAPGYLKSFLREFVGKFVSSIFLSLGYFWAIWDKEKQGWHDKIASTIVVKNTEAV